jgi:predicted RNase H-like HicB family nuclease
MKITAHCVRGEGWWVVDVPEIQGLYTQGRDLEEVRAMVLDAASLLTGRPETDFEVVFDVEGRVEP